MARSNLEISQIKEELRLFFEACFGNKYSNLAIVLGDPVTKVWDELILTLFKKKVGYLFEAGRPDYIDFVNLCHSIMSEETPALPPTATLKEEIVLPNGTVKRRGKYR